MQIKLLILSLIFTNTNYIKYYLWSRERKKSYIKKLKRKGS
jgi:hypothetical protein